MTLPLKPDRGGFLRPFGCGWFIREYLLGHGPEGSAVIDPERCAPIEDIRSAYKNALLKAHAEDMVALAMEKGIELSIEEALRRIPHRLTKVRSHSFYRYFHHLKMLGWVQPTGREAPSYVQGNYPDAPPCRYYRLSSKGREVTDLEWYRPQLTLYPDLTPEYFSDKNRTRRKESA